MMLTTKGQKYRSIVRPKGCASVGPLRARRIPKSSSTWFPVSATLCTASARVAVLPVTNAATNLLTAIARFPRSAAMTTFVELASADMFLVGSEGGMDNVARVRRRASGCGA